MSLKLTVNGHLHSKAEADAKRIEFIQQYGKGNNVDFVREAIDCLMEATRLYGHWSMMSKRDPAFVNRILEAISQIEAVAVDGNVKEKIEEVAKGFNFDSDSFFDEE